MTDFAVFDQRGYPTVSAREGYRDWVPTYESTVEDAMDLALLDRIESVDWAGVRRAADLGCGTGRTGAWLRAHGVAALDGVDLTPEMLAVAAERGTHDTLAVADVRDSGLTARAYDLAVSSLVDEHLPDVAPLYAEARRLLTDDGAFVLVGYHPFFSMSTGMPTHFENGDHEQVAIETYVHLPSDHVAAARAVGLVAHEMHERVVDAGWIELKPQWEPRRGWPISFAWVWRRLATGDGRSSSSSDR